MNFLLSKSSTTLMSTRHGLRMIGSAFLAAALGIVVLPSLEQTVSTSAQCDTPLPSTLITSATLNTPSDCLAIHASSRNAAQWTD